VNAMPVAFDNDDFSRRARAWFGIHGGRYTPAFARNLHSRAELVEVDGLALPATVDEGTHDSAWVCSPRATYSVCAMEEAARAVPWLDWPCAIAGAGLAAVLRYASVDRAVALNNWMLSTNLYPPLAQVPLDEVLAQARDRWPGHALWWRSLNDIDHADWIEALEARGFRRIASRQVYLFEDWDALWKRHPDLRRDRRLLDRTDLARTGDRGYSDADYDRIASLYAMLYLEKYSPSNPHYSSAFLRAWHRAGLLELDALRDGEGVLQSVTGMFRQGDTMTVPLVGYDTSRPLAEALYRRLNASAFEAARTRGLRLHLSAGAARFKRMRGGRPAIEYSLVSARGRPVRTRIATWSLAKLTAGIGVPLLRKYAL
jgi:hypothetical protein